MKTTMHFLMTCAIAVLAACGGENGETGQDSLDAADVPYEEIIEDALPELPIDLPIDTIGDMDADPPADLPFDTPDDPAADDGSGGEEGLLVWSLNGVEVARATGAEAGYSTGDDVYLFLPYWGRNVQAYFSSYSTLPTGTYSCTDYSTGPVNVSLITYDNGWCGLDALPDHWKELNISYCDAAGTYPDTIDMWIRLDQVGANLRGACQCTITGGGPRAGDTLVLDGTFDITL